MVSKGKKKINRDLEKPKAVNVTGRSPTDCSELCLRNITNYQLQAKATTEGPVGEKGKTPRNPKADREHQQSPGSVVLKTQLAEGRSPATPNCISGPSLHRCSAWAAAPLQRLPAASERGNTNPPGKRAELQKSHTQPQRGTIQRAPTKCCILESLLY